MEELIYQYKLLLNIMEEDKCNIVNSLQGDYFELYKSLLDMEMERIIDLINELYRIK